MMSKKVSSCQAIVFGARLLKGEQLFETVTSVWEDESNHLAMSRAFAGHHQIVLLIMHHNGDNKYLVEKGGLTFSIRMAYVADHEGKGVVPVQLAPESEGETMQGDFLCEREVRKLKYDLPRVCDLDKARLDKFMVKRLYQLMDMSSMPEDLKVVWDTIIQQADTDSDDESDDQDECDVDSFTDCESDDSSTHTIYSCEIRSVSSEVSSDQDEILDMDSNDEEETIGSNSDGDSDEDRTVED